ncbi:MAG: anthranilate synthase component I, partial [Pseudomonadota bacterium]|nr:anthranilate synthase component I [Pseudomonadota bacterium]
MNKQEFRQLRKDGFRNVPITREIIADLDTPLSCYIKLARGPYSYLLESAAQGGEKWSRFSIVGLPATKVIKISGQIISTFESGEIVESFSHSDPLEYIEAILGSINYPNIDEMPISTGGLVGYFGYDTVRYVENNLRDSVPKDILGVP